MSDTIETLSLSGAILGDGTIADNITLSGTWVVNYAPSTTNPETGVVSTGSIISITDATFVAMGALGTTTFTGGYDPNSSPSEDESGQFDGYEIFGHDGSNSTYQGLYVDYIGEAPTTLTTRLDPSFHTSIEDENGYVYSLVSTGIVTSACFAKGTHIATPEGETTVEALAVGDLVNTLDGVTLDGVKPVIWIGHRSIDLSTIKNPKDARLVRIRKGAFSDTTPHRDLWVTQDHCILVNGGLVPARMLVNGRSILLDETINSFTYYHVELQQHGILLAEGLQTESYLDTGNRGNFANADAVSLHPDLAINGTHASWAAAAAPLTVDAAIVKPIWNTLNARAHALGIAKTTVEPILTNDPGLHLITGNGAAIYPVRRTGDKYVFMLPAAASSLRLVSRTARPSDTIGAFMDDRRNLGVLVGEIALYDDRKKRTANSHLTTPGLPGWFSPDNAFQRWTNGDAQLALDLDRATFLEIQILHAGPYQLAHEIMETKVA